MPRFGMMRIVEAGCVMAICAQRYVEAGERRRGTRFPCPQTPGWVVREIPQRRIVQGWGVAQRFGMTGLLYDFGQVRSLRPRYGMTEGVSGFGRYGLDG